jgi:hypothetical protein
MLVDSSGQFTNVAMREKPPEPKRTGDVPTHGSCEVQHNMLISKDCAVTN